MSDLISRFRDYQIEWLTAHNDIEFCEEEETLIIGFLKDTAESFIRENQSEQQWIPPRRCIDCENFNKTQLLVPQAQQQKKGHWKGERLKYPSGIINFIYHCSECGYEERHAYEDTKPSNFCPDCGAYMRGENNG